MEKIKILFLCTGHSCRAPMAEAWMKKLAGQKFAIKSAGIEANGIHPFTKKVMAEVDIDLSKMESVSLKGDLLDWADLVITLCDNAQEQCPVIDDTTAKLHLPLADPSRFKGEDEEMITVFRESRDEVKKRVDFVLTQLMDR